MACMIVVAVWKEAAFHDLLLRRCRRFRPTARAGAIEGAGAGTSSARDLPSHAHHALVLITLSSTHSARDHIMVRPRWARQHELAVLFYIYEVGFKFWDTATRPRSRGNARLLALFAVAQFAFLDRRIHYQ